MQPGTAGSSSATGFKYRAKATGLEGHIELPIDRKIDPVASVTLDEDGGFNNARVENFRFEHVVAFDSSSVSVTGAFSKKDSSHFTVTTSIVEGVDVLGIVTADRIVARVLVRAPAEDANAEPSILATGSHFENLVIAGHPVKVRLNTGVLCELDTYGKACSEGPKRLGSAFLGRDGEDGDILCTLVESIDTGGAPELQLRGRDSIFIEQVGTIRFGEVLVNRHHRSVTMMRVELGCGHEGSLALASAEGGGSTGGPKATALSASEGGGSTGGPKATATLAPRGEGGGSTGGPKGP